jgi:hypothetical protein
LGFYPTTKVTAKPVVIGNLSKTHKIVKKKPRDEKLSFSQGEKTLGVWFV